MTGSAILKAMVIEYNAVVRRQLEEALRAMGFSVAATDDPARALGWLARHRPHVIVLDFGLPAMVGDDFVARAASSAAGAGIPVIATGTRHQAEAPAGTVAWLRKPIGSEDLEAALRLALAASPDIEPPREPEPPLPDAGEAVSTTTSSLQAVEAAVLSWFRPDGRVTLPIESVTETGLRVLAAEQIELGTSIGAQLDFVEVRRSGHRARTVTLALRVDSVSEAQDGWRCGLKVEQARPPHLWKRFCDQQPS